MSETILKRILLSSVLLALVLGVAVGPAGLGVIDPGATGDERAILGDFARLTLAISLMAAGLHVTRADLREVARPAALLLSVGMVGMWTLTGLGAWLLLDLPFWAGFLLGAVLTPTDPVVASTIVTGAMARANIPRPIRRTLLVESGANDGLALPFVLLALFMLADPPGEALARWAPELLRTVVLSALAGAAMGWGSGKLVELAVHEHEIERANLLGFGIALALLVLGGVHLLGGSGVLAVFVAALAFSLVLEERVRDELEQVQESVTRFFLFPIFTYLGAMLPWHEWRELGVAGVAFAAWVLVVRRPAAAALALAVSGTRARDTAFLAWFGPVGVAAIFYATLVDQHGVPESDTIFAAATLAVSASVLVHAVTATPGVRLLAGRSPFTPLRHPLRREVESDP